MLVEDFSISLTEEEYGVIENGGILPFRVRIPEEAEADFMDVLTHVHAWLMIEEFEYEEAE